jgi:hypothetical protein
MADVEDSLDATSLSDNTTRKAKVLFVHALRLRDAPLA